MATKKTTLMIDSGLYEAVRLKAIKQGRSISSAVAEAIRRYVSTPEEKPKEPFELPVLEGKFLVPPEIYTSNAALQELFDEEALREGGIDSLR